MKIYILNHYIGGTPMDSHTMGIYKTLKEAKEEFNKTFELFGYKEDDEDIVIEHTKEEEVLLLTDVDFPLSKNEQMNVISTWFIDDDSCDFWGGCEIQVMDLK
tara:strand:+ start:2315 stop:2623 length:309 start_codon:yes stop_codon:yes gene_type:complete